MLQRRMGWATMRNLLHVSTNHFKAPGPEEWPEDAVEALNVSKLIASDEKFLMLASRQYAEQVRASLLGLVVFSKSYVSCLPFGGRWDHQVATFGPGALRTTSQTFTVSSH